LFKFDKLNYMKNLILQLIITMSLIACKKSNTANSSTTNQTPLANTGTPSATITPIALQTYGYASFEFVGGQILASTTHPTASYNCNGQVTFYNSASNGAAKVSVQGVFLDSMALSYSTSGIVYGNAYGSPGINATNCTWQVYGTNGIPSFTYASNLIPQYVNPSALPDTLDHTKAFSAFIQFTAGSNINGTSILSTAPQLDCFNSNGSYTTTTSFSSAKMATLPVGTATIVVTITNFDQESVNGLPMLFYSKKIVSKIVRVK
jgi:hypothetical protein